MADIELVIKIPEEIINEINDENYQRIIWWYDTTLYRAIKDGTPLPKGHGRLIDADDLEECKEIVDTISGGSKYAVRMDYIRNMSTIIEADKENLYG